MRGLRASNALPLILVVALAVRIGVIVATPAFLPIFDAFDYDRHAESIASGHGYPAPYGAPPNVATAFRPPLYPLLLVPVHWVGAGWTAERLLGAILGTATVLLIFLIARRLWGRRVAIVAGSIAAIFPPLVLLNASLLSEQLFLVLVLATLLASLRYREAHQLRWAALAGVLCGLCALTRSSGLLLFLAAALGVWHLRPRFSRAAVVAPAVVAVAAVLTVTPWMIRNTVVFHRFVGITTQSGYALAGTYNTESLASGRPGKPLQPQFLATFHGLFAQRDLDQAERSDRLTARAMNFAFDHPGYVAETLLWNTGRVFEVVHDKPFRLEYQAETLMAGGVEGLVSPVIPLSLYLIVVLALAGVAAEAGFLKSTRAPAFVWAFPVVTVLPAIGVWGLSRYRAPDDPFLVMLGAVGIIALADALLGARRSARGPSSDPA